MLEYIYLDSNAFWVMKPKHPSVDDDFRETVARLHEDYRFPFSEAHFVDIAASDKPGNEHNVKYDLNFLGYVSRGNCVSLSLETRKPPEELYPTVGPIPGKDWIIHPHFDDVAAAYREMDKSDPQELQANLFTNLFRDFYGEKKVAVEIADVPKEHPLLDFLKVANGLLSAEVLQDYMADFWMHRNDPLPYKHFRQWVVDALNKSAEKNAILGPDRANKIADLTKFFSARTVDDITDTLVNAANVLCLIRGEVLDDLSWPQKLVTAYNLLSFHPERWDKINKDNRPSNMMCDSKHLVYAAGAAHFVTADKRFAAKATVTFSAFGIGTEISDLADFKAKFSGNN
tara:strand:+ start:2654 stop:3682 length:1029 start_codon:yes stop_codon:yes gene_type:complete